MKTLYQKFEILLQNTPTNFKRYLFDKVSWESRMIGIIGARGVGKTTMILQYIKENLDSKSALYVSADDMYFGENRLLDLADDFYKNAGEYLFIDDWIWLMIFIKMRGNIYLLTKFINIQTGPGN